MAVITNKDNFSSIQIKKDIHFIFGSLNDELDDNEKIKIAITGFNNYFESIGLGDEKPEIIWDWREVKKEGQWILSDDMRLMEVLKLTLGGTRTDSSACYNKGVIRTCNATFPINPSVFLDSRVYDERDRYRISNKNMEFDHKLRERKKPTYREERFVSFVAHGKEPFEAYMKSFKTENEDYAKMSANRLLSQERVSSLVSKKVEDLMEEEGVSKRYILQSYKNLIDNGLADLENNSSAVRGALQDLSKMQAMFPEKNTQKSTMGVLEEIDDAEIEEIEEVEQNLNAGMLGDGRERDDFSEINEKTTNDWDKSSNMAEDDLFS